MNSINDLIDDENGMTWGITLLIFLIIVSAISYVFLGPVISGVYDGFSGSYSDDMISDRGMQTADRIYSIFGYIPLISILFGVTYLLFRSITEKNN